MKQLSTILLMCFSCWLTAQPCDIPPSSLDCIGAPILCSISELDGYCTSMPNFDNPAGPNPLCGSNGGGVSNNNIWFGFVAWDTKMSISVIPSNCTDIGGQKGIQGGIYIGANGCDNISELVCQGNCSTFAMTLTSSDFIVGEIYYFILDGCAGSVCDITVDVILGNGIPTLGDPDDISGPDYVCKGGTYKYSVPEVKAAASWYWTLDSLLLLDPFLASNEINIPFDSVGMKNVCIDIANFCFDVNEAPIQKCKQVIVVDKFFPQIEKVVLLCPGDSVFYKGVYYKQGEAYLDTVAVDQGCSVTVSNMVTNYISPVKDLGDVFICPGECFSISIPGAPQLIFCDTISNAQAIIPNYLGCDSLITFNVRRGLSKKDTSFITVTLCDQDSIKYGNLDIEDIGLYFYSFSEGDSCQLVELNVVSDTIPSNVNLIKCKNKPVSYLGISYSNPGIYSVPNSINACKPNMTLIINEIECKGDYETNQQTGNDNGALMGKIGANENSESMTTQTQDVREIVLFPNPTKNSLQIVSQLPIEISDWQVYNTLGQQVLQSNKDEHYPVIIDVSTLSSGLYYWKGLVNGQQVLRQFMKIE